MEEINKVILKVPGKNEVQLYPQAGGSGTPGPDSVGSDQIQDEGVKMKDLDKGIQDKLEALDESNVVSEGDIKDMWEEAMQNAGLDPSGNAGNTEAGEVTDSEIEDLWSEAMQNAGLDLGG